MVSEPDDGLAAALGLLGGALDEVLPTEPDGDPSWAMAILDAAPRAMIVAPRDDQDPSRLPDAPGEKEQDGDSDLSRAMELLGRGLESSPADLGAS